MDPEDIRRLFRRETAATAHEAAATQDAARTDPEMARKLLLTLYALADADREFRALLSLVLHTALGELVRERAAVDDAFALTLGAIMVRAMEAMQPTPRGKKARSA